MAHNIFLNEQTGKYSFFSVQQTAWHGLGQIVTDYPTSEEAMKFAGLDYVVEKRKLYTPDSGETNTDGDTLFTEMEVPNFFATVRKDTDAVLGVVGKEYHIVQNADAFSFFDAIVGGGEGIMYETAGALGKNGERIFITAKMPDYIRVGNDDLIEKYVFLTTSHDGTGSITAALTPTRIVCNNTLNVALGNCSNVVKIRHTQSANERLKEAHKVMGMVNKLTPMLEEIYNQWAKVRITDKQVLQLIQLAMCPNKEVLSKLTAGQFDETSTAFKNICNDAFEYAMTSETQQMVTTKGTVFGCFNAVTGYFQNVRTYKDDTAKMNSLLDGGTAQRRAQTAFDLCTAFAKNGADSLQFN
ncbi:DUF932 domain-containing protein [Mucilaginibacter paludis]|uniref:Phage/plasmid-related protein TIGR03299 n=1 Tax=Mucilaginibacter paludis DSM 18603 TaxID=714943 RepID=H1YDT6_9SPHI|nr:DUF932 domain-containing protein [Mucilaginibacter paludis]EHQ24276.1 phage/plasmid-related protein TIGR03299 [Mucilaginibacter paludis DSM 18603]